MAHKKLRSTTLLEFNLKSNSNLQIMQLLWWTYKNIYIFISLKQQRKHTIYKHKLNAIW
jgi:hypothetical protein